MRKIIFFNLIPSTLRIFSISSRAVTLLKISKYYTKHKLKVQGARYTTIIGELYRRGFFALLLKCLTKTRSEYVLEEIHKGICGVHTRGQSMATHVQCVGYYWPTIGSDCIDYVKKCSDCQKHGNLIHQPANELHKIVSP